MDGKMKNVNINPAAANKTADVNGIKSFFTINALSYAADKRELLNYRAMAVETGVSEFIKNADFVLNKRYPSCE